MNQTAPHTVIPGRSEAESPRTYADPEPQAPEFVALDCRVEPGNDLRMGECSVSVNHEVILSDWKNGSILKNRSISNSEMRQV